MKTRPILFSGPMIRALLANEKTQTRRVVKATRYCSLEGAMPDHESDGRPYLCCNLIGDIGLEHLYCPYGDVGDRLWCRETWAPAYSGSGGMHGAMYKADHMTWLNGPAQWKPSIFMPRALSRITLEITDVRVERVQSISDDDVIAEGAFDPRWTRVDNNVQKHYASLWDSINAKRGHGWEMNPWVWVVSFRQVQP